MEEYIALSHIFKLSTELAKDLLYFIEWDICWLQRRRTNTNPPVLSFQLQTFILFDLDV